MQNVQEGGKGVTRDFSNLSLVHQGLIEQIGSVLLLAIAVFGARYILAILFGLLFGSDTWDIEAHFDQLVVSTGRLLASELCSSQVSVCASIAVGGKGEVYCDLVLSSQVGVGYFGVRHFEGGAIRNIESKLCFAKVGLAPVPATQRVLAVVQVDAIPRLEDL